MTQAQVVKALLANPALLAQLLGNAKPSKKAKAKKRTADVKPTGDQFVGAMILACKAQFGADCDVQPRVNVLTWDKWDALGRRVIPGSKSIVVAGRKTGLFHISQTDVIAA